MTPLPRFRAFWPQKVSQKVKSPGHTVQPGRGDDDEDDDDHDDDDDVHDDDVHNVLTL